MYLGRSKGWKCMAVACPFQRPGCEGAPCIREPAGQGRQSKRRRIKIGWGRTHVHARTHARVHTHTHTHARTHARTVLSSMKSRSQTRALLSSWRVFALLRKSRSRSSLSSSKRWSWRAAGAEQHGHAAKWFRQGGGH